MKDMTLVHRGIRFRESEALGWYIDFNTQMHANTEVALEQNFDKLMNNSVYGKTIENVRNYVEIRLVTKEKELQKLIGMPIYKSQTIFDENLVVVHMQHTKVLFDKPIYVGVAILDLNKTLMYDFHYEYMQKKYGERAEMMYTDMDSFVYGVETDDFFKRCFS